MTNNFGERRTEPCDACKSRQRHGINVIALDVREISSVNSNTKLSEESQGEGKRKRKDSGQRKGVKEGKKGEKGEMKGRKGKRKGGKGKREGEKTKREGVAALHRPSPSDNQPLEVVVEGEDADGGCSQSPPTPSPPTHTKGCTALPPSVGRLLITTGPRGALTGDS